MLNPSNHLYISEASLPEYAADHMFVVVCEGNGSYQEMKKQVSSSAGWSNLPAVRRDRIYPLRLEEFWCCDGLLLERQLDKQVDLLVSGNKF
ncbi:hypothetical protein [Brevibacillus sp. VP]|uniref:hypothetical protein n=1 Tax=unclassified Brevibacillus TaxID=2684853 RepID=UPI0011C02D75|nr:hypothetical protein [Brevibacillus sp. VP]